MELNATGSLAAQRRYARWLAWGTRLGLGLLILGFVAYISGVAPHVPIETLPQLWGRPSAELLAQTGVRPGWGWAAFLPRSDMLVMAAIGVLASSSIPCLLAVAPVFAKSRERAFLAICVLEVAVLALAASGILAGGH